MKKSPLKRRTGLRKVSEKQAEANALWLYITVLKASHLRHICQWCGKRMYSGDGHHIIKRSSGKRIDTYDNCFVCHRIPCHDQITKENIDVRVYPNLESWNRRNDAN